jgi:hypothetical protein
MKTILFRIILPCVWIAGIVLAEGFWSTFFAIVFPPWDVILVIGYLFS